MLFTKRFDNTYSKTAIETTRLQYLSKDVLNERLQKISCEMKTKSEGVFSGESTLLNAGRCNIYLKENRPHSSLYSSIEAE